VLAYTGIIDHRYDAEFRRQRKLSLSIMKEFGFGKDIMEQRIQAEVSILLQHIRDINSEAFCPCSALTSSVLNVIASIVFGRRMETEAAGELAETIDSFFCTIVDLFVLDVFPLMRFLPNIRRCLATCTGLYNCLFRVIRNCIKMSDEDSFVQYYRNREGSRLDMEQLEFIVRDLLMAGTETSSSTLQWTLLLLAQRDGQCVQDRMRSEIDSHVPGDRLPSLADRQRMPFVEATILELMRVKTVGPLALAHRTLCDTNLGGYFIPANTVVTIISCCHRYQRATSVCHNVSVDNVPLFALFIIMRQYWRVLTIILQFNVLLS